MVVDTADLKFNVTWSRTTPITIFTLDDAYSTLLTGEMDHRRGMDVTGTAGNVWAFRFVCSSAFSVIEQEVGNTIWNTTQIGSVTMGIGKSILNGEIPELFYSNGYLVFKIQGKDDLILVLDPVTGVVRDFGNGICGMYCFHDQITDSSILLGGRLASSDPNVQPGWLRIIGSVVMSAAAEAGAGSSALIGGTTVEVTGGATGVIGLSSLGAGLVYGGGVVGMSVAVAVLLYEPYFMLYEMPEKLRILEEMNEIATNQTPLWIGTVSLFLPEDRGPTLENCKLL